MLSPVERLREELYGDGPGSLSIESMVDWEVPEVAEGLPSWDEAWGEAPAEDAEIDEEAVKAEYVKQAAKKGEATKQYQRKQQMGAQNGNG